jgi:hypothetical protein
MTTMDIPLDGDEQDRAIMEDDGVHRSSGWRLAGRIYARCRPEPKGTTKLDRLLSVNLPDNKVSIAELSRRTGRSERNIRHHRQNWVDAIAKGWVGEVRPGDTVELPTVEYPPTGHGGGNRDAFTAGTSAAAKKVALKKMMAHDAEFAAAVDELEAERIITNQIAPEARDTLDNAIVQRVGHSLHLIGRAQAISEEYHPRPIRKPVPPNPFVYVGFAGSFVAVLEQRRAEVVEFVHWLREQHDQHHPEATTYAHNALEGLHKARGVLEEYEDMVRGSDGSDYASTFKRLVGRD